MTARLVRACLAAACASLALGYALGGVWPGAAAGLGLGLLWLALYSPRRPWPDGLGLAGCVALAGLGAWLLPDAGWMLLAVVAALCAWDLAGLAGRLARLDSSGETLALERQHLRRLVPVAGLGLLLGAAALLFELRLSFWPALLLGLLAVAGLSWVTSLLRSEA